MGSFVGAVVGGLGLGLMQQLTAGYISSLFSNTLTLVLLLAVLIWRPGGILGGSGARREDVREFIVHRALPATRLKGRTAWALAIAGTVTVGGLPLFLGATGQQGTTVS